MPITLNPACPLCGLRFGNQPLLDLHIREDHRQPVFGERSGDDDPGSTGALASEAPKDTPARRNGLSRVLRIFRFSSG